jgi:TolB protein
MTVALVALSACTSSTEAPTQEPSTSAAAPSESDLPASAGDEADEPSPSAPAPSESDLPETAGDDRIAFTRFATDINHPILWTANIDGSNPAPVGDQTAWFPDWSPDRTLLLFGFTDENDDDQIATIRPDGSELTLLTEGVGYNEAPDYSLDGKSIIYAHSDVRPEDPNFGGTELWLMNSDGSGKHPLQLADGGGDDTEAEYSPDGTQIVFARYRHDANDTRAIHVAAADGSDVRRLTPWQHIVEHPRWSPDGRTIIYNIENDDDAPSNKGEGIWTVPASGGKPVLLLASTYELHGFKPDYSPDGSRVVFACAPNHRTTEEICVMNADGTDARQIFDEPGYDNHVVWR